jgi:arylformamidase
MTSAAQSNPPWQQMSIEQRESAYSPSSCIGGNYQPFIAAYQTCSRDARDQSSSEGASWHTHRYGEQPTEQLALCLPSPSRAVAGRPAGLLVFIHGGYWQELSAQDSLFPAAACARRGLAFAALDYTLAPAASVADIVVQCRRALVWVFQHAQALGVDASRIVVAGSSAGAHLAAMVAMPDALPDGEGSSYAVRAAVLVSGIYELEPLVGSSINSALALNPVSARQVSPSLLALSGFPRSVVCWGAVETEEFKRQSRDFATALATAGTPRETFEVPLRNHFDVILDLSDPSTRLGATTFSLFEAN